jgi:hypothetical protein
MCGEIEFISAILWNILGVVGLVIVMSLVVVGITVWFNNQK